MALANLPNAHDLTWLLRYYRGDNLSLIARDINRGGGTAVGARIRYLGLPSRPHGWRSGREAWLARPEVVALRTLLEFWASVQSHPTTPTPPTKDRAHETPDPKAPRP